MLKPFNIVGSLDKYILFLNGADAQTHEVLKYAQAGEKARRARAKRKNIGI